VTRLRQIMLEELRRRNFATTTIESYIHGVEHFSQYFHRPPDQLGPKHIRQYQAMLFTELKLSPNRDRALGRLTLLLYSRIEEKLEHCGDASPEEGAALAAGAEPGRSRTSDRRGRVSLSSHPADDAVCDGRTSRRSGAPEDQRYRQSTYGHSYSGRQGTQGPRCHAQPEAARGIARLLAWTATQAYRLAVPRQSMAYSESSGFHQGSLERLVRRPPNALVLSTSASIPTLCATALPRICSKPAPTCGAGDRSRPAQPPERRTTARPADAACQP